jgi:hypothetical protein
VSKKGYMKITKKDMIKEILESYENKLKLWTYKEVKEYYERQVHK